MRRRAIVIVVYLTLGAITTVAMAWGCAAFDRLLFSDHRGWCLTAEHAPCWQVLEYRDFGSRWRVGRAIQTDSDLPAVQQQTPQNENVIWPFDFGGHGALRSSPISFAGPAARDFDNCDRHVLDMRGWPFPALSCTAVYRFKESGYAVARHHRYESRVVSGGWADVVAPDRRLRVIDEALIPFTPLWTGMMADTLIVAGCWWALRQFMRLLRATLRPMPAARRAFFAATCFVLAILGTIGAAWGFAARVFVADFGDNCDWARGESRPAYQDWQIHVTHRPGSVRVHSWCLAYPIFDKDEESPVPPGDLLPSWAEAARAAADDDPNKSVLRVVDGRGWPMCAMWSAFEMPLSIHDYLPTGEVQSLRWGIRLSDYTMVRAGFFPDTVRLLPLGIAWPGFLVDAALHSAAWLVVFTLALSPWTWRRWRRDRTGRCVACGYPIGTSPVCTECGEPVKPRADRASP